MDDIETLRNTSTPDQRAKTRDYLDKDVINSADQTGQKFTYFRGLGTVVHPDGYVARAVASPAWDGRRWQAIERWPDRPELWEDLRRIWHDTSREKADREALVRDMYRDDRERLDAGARILWPESLTLYDLYERLWQVGSWVFWAEFQNEPKHSEFGIFQTEKFRRCRFDHGTLTTSGGKVHPKETLSLALWLDPIPPQGGGDYAAVAVVARDPKSGARFLLSCSLLRGSPTDQIQAVWRAWDAWRPFARHFTGGFEDNGFQAVMSEYWHESVKQRAKQSLPYDFQLMGYTSSESKEARIMRLQPGLEYGMIEVADTVSPEVLAQASDFPSGSFDDGLDAWERADNLLSGGLISRASPGWAT